MARYIIVYLLIVFNHFLINCSAMSRVYTLSQAFRAEKSDMKHNKHLNEFIMFEVEEAFVESLDHLMNRVESVCKFLAYYSKNNCTDDLDVIMTKMNHKYFDKILNSKYFR